MNFSQRFQQADKLLTDYQNLLKYKPFINQKFPQGASSTEQQLVESCQSLSTQELDLIESQPEKFTEFLKLNAPKLASAIEPLKEYESDLQNKALLKHLEVDPFFNKGIPGKKWLQIQAFSALTNTQNLPIIDWCSGKGHLARLLSFEHEQPVTCFEYDPTLCLSGKALSEVFKLPIEHICHDVRKPLPIAPSSKHHHTALHACGDLHVTCLNTVIKTQAAGVTLSPCCYHKIPGSHYTALSSQAKQSTLSLSRQDVSTAVAETITGGARVTTLRNTERLWRLAFNELQKKSRNTDRYLPIPSCPKSLFSKSFQYFCEWACDQKQITLSTPINYEYALQEAEKILIRVRKLELATNPLKRPLELWLILDRLLFLEESHYDCQLSIFCNRAITPRNFLISAYRKE